MSEAPSQTLAAPVGILNGAPGVAAFSAAPTIVWSPTQSDVRDVNSYASLADACSTLKSVGASTGMLGPRVLAVRDPSATGYTYNTAGTLDPGPETTWNGANQGELPTSGSRFALTWQNGTVASIPGGFEQINVQLSATAAKSFVTSSQTGRYAIDVYNSQLGSGLSSLPVFALSGNPTIVVYCRGTTALLEKTFTSGTIQVVLYDSAQLGPNAVPSGSGIVVASPGAFVDSSYYATLSISGLFVDTTGAGLANINPASSVAGALLLDATTGLLYETIQSAWVPVQNTFIFRPGGSSGPNVITTEANLSLALAHTTGARIIFDLSASSGTYAFTTAGTLNLGNGNHWTDLGLGYTLTFSAGTQLSSIPSFDADSALTVNLEQAVNVNTLASGSTVTRIGGSTTLSQNGTGISTESAWVNVQSGATLKLYASDNAILTGSEYGDVVLGQTGSTIQAYAEDGAQFQADSLASSGTLSVEALSPSASIDQSLYANVTIRGMYVDQANGFVAAGIANTVSGNGCVAIGNNNTTSGGAHAISLGSQNQSTSNASVAIGNACTSTNLATVAAGFESNATGQSAIALGVFGNATGSGSVAIGNTCTASAQGSVAAGWTCSSALQGQLATGVGCTAVQYGERAHGVTGTPGTLPVVTLRDVAMVANPSASSVASSVFTMTDGSSSFALNSFSSGSLKVAMTVEVRVTALLVSGSSQSFIQKKSLVSSGTGTWSIAGSGTPEQFGTAGMSGWTLVITTDGNNLILTLNTNAGAAAFTATARLTYDVTTQ